MSSSKKFPDDHVIEMLRGVKVPSTSNIMRTFAMRARWLCDRIEKYPMRGVDPKASFLVAELAAISVSVELIVAQRDRNNAANAPRQDATLRQHLKKFVLEAEDKWSWGPADDVIGLLRGQLGMPPLDYETEEPDPAAVEAAGFVYRCPNCNDVVEDVTSHWRMGSWTCAKAAT